MRIKLHIFISISLLSHLAWWTTLVDSKNHSTVFSRKSSSLYVVFLQHCALNYLNRLFFGDNGLPYLQTGPTYRPLSQISILLMDMWNSAGQRLSIKTYRIILFSGRSWKGESPHAHTPLISSHLWSFFFFRFISSFFVIFMFNEFKYPITCKAIVAEKKILDEDHWHKTNERCIFIFLHFTVIFFFFLLIYLFIFASIYLVILSNA